MARHRRTRGTSPVPFVMGQGRDLWNAVYADAHTWGSKVTVTRRRKYPPSSANPTAGRAETSIAKPTGKICALCNAAVEAGEVVVPLRGVGMATEWAHKTCRP